MSWEHVKYLEERINKVEEDIAEITLQVNQMNAYDTTINQLLYIQDYKTHGENSAVFQNKDVLHDAHMTWYAINDKALREESVIDADSMGRVGELLAKQYGIKCPQIKEYKTLDAIKNTNDREILDELYLEDGSLVWLFNSVLNQNFYLAKTARDLYYPNYGEKIRSDICNLFYDTYSESFVGEYEKTLECYNSGRWWSPFENQTFLRSNYESLITKWETVSDSLSRGGGGSNIGTTTGNEKPCMCVLYLSASQSSDSTNATIVSGPGGTISRIDISGEGNKSSSKYLFKPTTSFTLSLYYNGFYTSSYSTGSCTAISDQRKNN